jgi:hypothetical protein
MPSDVIKFLRSEGRDHKCRTLIGLLAMNDAELEKSHDVIQWLFPSDLPSMYAPFAPVLTAEDIETMKTDEIVQAALKMCLERMIHFYENSNHWITLHNHNYKRITRMLRCLWLAGLKHDYVSLSKALDDVFIENPDTVGEETYLYWKNANNDFFMKNPSFKAAILSNCEAPKQLPEDHASIEMFRAQMEFGPFSAENTPKGSDFNYEDFQYV